MKNNDDFESDEELYASYDAYKALIEAGLSKPEALKRTGLTPQSLKDLEEEDEDSDIKDEFSKEEWDTPEEGEEVDDFSEEDWEEEDFDEDDEWEDEELGDDEFEGGATWDD